MMTSTTNHGRDSIPRVQHISYFQAALEGIAEGLTFDVLRGCVRQVSNELSRRIGGGITASRLEDAYTLWSPTTDAIGELMKLDLVERRPLPSKRISVDAHRDTTYALTQSGKEIIEQSHGDGSAFRRALTPLLIKRHTYFSSLCAALVEEPILIPEYSEEELKEYKQTNESWTVKLSEDAAERMRRSMKLANVSSGAVTAQIRGALEKRFPPGAEPTTKDILDTTLDALVVASLEARGLLFDAITFNVLMSWGRQLFVIDESRYVHGMLGRTIWSTADIKTLDDSITVSRRGLSEYGVRVANQLEIAYRDIADAISSDLGGPAVRYPYLEIFKVRALAAYRVGVNISLVDRVIAEIVEQTRPATFRIELQLGTSSWTFSEPPFRLGSRRYYVILIKPEGDE